MDHSSVEHSIAGTYQLDALLSGWRLQRAWHRARLDLVARVLPPDRGGPVLDAAAGAGIITWRFRPADIVSTDMRVSACQSVRSHTPRARAAAADLAALPFRSGAFSKIYLLEVIEHLTAEEGRQALSELRRVSRAGARFLITTPNYRSYWVPTERLLDRFRLTPPMADAQHVSRYDRDRLMGVVESCGWKVVSAGSFNLFAPFLGIISTRAARWALEHEVRRGTRAGALLYALCEPAGEA